VASVAVEGGRKSRTGRWPGDRAPGWALIDTLWAGRQKHCERLTVEVVSGEGVMASSRWLEKNPRECETTRGDRAVVRVNARANGNGLLPGL